MSSELPSTMGRIHIGLSRFTSAVEPPVDLRHRFLFEDAFVAAIPAQHPLAGQPAVSLAALAELPLISYPKDPYSSFARHVLSVLHAAGARPLVGHEANEIHTGLGYAVVGASVAQRGQSDVVFVDLPEIQARTTVLAVTRADEESMLVASMLAYDTGRPCSAARK